MKPPYLLLLVLSGMVFSTSCITAYFPTKPNVPLFRERGEITGAVAISPTSYQAHAAYALTDYLAVAGSVSEVHYESSSPDQRTSGLQFDFAPGMYFPTGEKTTADIYFGFGQSVIETSDEFNIPLKDYLMSRYFAQSSWGLVSKNFEAGLGFRFVVVSADERINNEQDLMSFLEPFGVLRIGGGHVKMELSAGYVQPFSSIVLDYSPFFMTAGIQFRLNTFGE